MTLEWIKDNAPNVAPFITYSDNFSSRSDDSVKSVTESFEFKYKDYSTQIDTYRALFRQIIQEHPERLDQAFVENLDAQDTGTNGTHEAYKIEKSASLINTLDEVLPLTTIKLPTGAMNNPKPDPDAKIPDAFVVDVEPNRISDNAVITIIIDEGMNPFHDCFRYDTNKTRVLMSWQQAAPYAEQDPSLPFGHELNRKDIEDTLERITNGDMTEEQAFYETGMINTDPDSVGTSMLSRSSHGMHTAGLAAGRNADDPALELNPVILINLPPRSAIGTSGVYLPAFITPALIRMFEWLDALWVAAKQDPQQTHARWKTVVNISYGQSAGPKDGTELLEQHITRISNDRHTLGSPRPVIVMPVGNNNLERSHIEFSVEESAATKIGFRLQPQDHTPTQLEIWTTVQQQPDWPFKASLWSPGQHHEPNKPNDQSNQQTADIMANGKRCGQAFARRYEVETDGKTTYRFQYVFILNPTHSWDPNTLSPSPSGEWALIIQNASKGELVFYGDIEVDQSLKSDSRLARSAYFTDLYKHPRFDPAGRPFDVGDIRQKSIDSVTQQVKQIGCHNSLANGENVMIIAGHRSSDGLPAPYSSAMRSYAPNGQGSRLPDASFPCDDAMASIGVLSAGIKSGSNSIRNGTSFSAAMATRHIVQNLLEGRPPFNHADIANSERQLVENWEQISQTSNSAIPEKIGSIGRAPAEPSPFADRLSSGWR